MARKTSAPRARQTVSDQLREAIGSRGLTLAELGQASGVDPTVIGRFVSGERELRTGTVDRLAGALGLRLVGVAPTKGPSSRPKAKVRGPGRSHP